MVLRPLTPHFGVRFDFPQRPRREITCRSRSTKPPSKRQCSKPSYLQRSNARFPPHVRTKLAMSSPFQLYDRCGTYFLMSPAFNPYQLFDSSPSTSAEHRLVPATLQFSHTSHLFGFHFSKNTRNHDHGRRHGASRSHPSRSLHPVSPPPLQRILLSSTDYPLPIDDLFLLLQLPLTFPLPPGLDACGL